MDTGSQACLRSRPRLDASASSSMSSLLLDVLYTKRDRNLRPERCRHAENFLCTPTITMPATPAQNNTLDNTFGETIKQYGGPVQVTRAVKVKAPGKHFNGLTGAEAKKDYWGMAVESKERHDFERHNKAWGAAHKGPGIRFVCESDAVDDPDQGIFFTQISVIHCPLQWFAGGPHCHCSEK